MSGRRSAPSLPRRVDFGANEILPSLPFSNQRELVPAHEHFCRQWTRIVIGSHHEPVRTRAHDREQIAFVDFRHFPVQRKKITRLTYRPNNFDLLRLILTLALAPARLVRRRRAKAGALADNITLTW